MVQLAQMMNANGFVTISLLTIKFVTPLSSDHTGFRRYISVLLLLLLLLEFPAFLDIEYFYLLKWDHFQSDHSQSHAKPNGSIIA